MKKDERLEIVESREYVVTKGNEIIQRARYDLSLTELKAFSFIVSKIKPEDKEGEIYSFSINEYCKVLGIETNNGKNIQTVKKSLKRLRDTSFYLTLENGTETTVGWLGKVWINSGSGKVKVRLDEDLQKHLVGLLERGNYTQYTLICTLPMRSAYSFRIYELLRSYVFQNKKQYCFELEDLKRKLVCEHYDRFPDFRRKVLDKAVVEINKYTDIEVQWQPITKGKKVVEIGFTIKHRDIWDRSIAMNRASKEIETKRTVKTKKLKESEADQIEGQLTIYDYYKGEKNEKNEV